MADIILPNGEGKTEEPYDFSRDIEEFTTKITRACREHDKLHIATMIGVLNMVVGDLHHAVIANTQQAQMMQTALQKMNAARIQRNN